MESVLELAIADFMSRPRVVMLCGVDGVKICNGGHDRKYQRCKSKGRPGCGPVRSTRDSSDAAQARAWIMSDEHALFSFVGICETFNIDPHVARRELLRRRKAGERVSMETIRFAVNRPRSTLFLGHQVVEDPSLKSGEITLGVQR